MLHEVAVFSSHHPGGPIVVMDDVGGDRVGTVLALEHLIWQIEVCDIAVSLFGDGGARGGGLSSGFLRS